MQHSEALTSSKTRIGGAKQHSSLGIDQTLKTREPGHGDVLARCLCSNMQLAQCKRRSIQACCRNWAAFRGMKRNAHILSKVHAAYQFIFRLRLRGVEYDCFKRHRSTNIKRGIRTYRSPAHPTMKTVTWNVNGLKAVLNRRFGSIRSLLQYLKAGMLAFSAKAASCSDVCPKVSTVRRKSFQYYLQTLSVYKRPSSRKQTWSVSGSLPSARAGNTIPPP